MLVWQDIVYTEVCDPKTFRRVRYGERGTPVYTHLERTSQPMIRLVSGDLTLWRDGPTPCGRTYPHLPNGIFGRIDDSFTVRGENIYPSEIDATLNALPGYGGEHRIVITREAAMDELIVQVEAANAIALAGPESLERFRYKVADEIQRVLGIRAVIEVVGEQSIPRTDFKARRVIDDRQVFREFAQKLGAGA
jgi:phenylacetate-CoA ligase